MWLQGSHEVGVMLHGSASTQFSNHRVKMIDFLEIINTNFWHHLKINAVTTLGDLVAHSSSAYALPFAHTPWTNGDLG